MKMAAIVWGLLHPFVMFPVWNWQERRERKKNGMPPPEPRNEPQSDDDRYYDLFHDEHE